MRVNVNFFLTWLPCFDFGLKEFVKFRNSLSIATWLIGIIGMIVPFPAIESIITKDFHKQSSRENIAFETNVVPFAAFVAASNVIIGISEIDNHVISHFLYDFKGVFKERLTVSHTLIIRMYTKRPHRDDWLCSRSDMGA